MKFTQAPLLRLIRATKNSIAGISYLWSHESAFRQEIYVGCVLMVILIFMPVISLIKFILTLLFFLLLVIEAINSAIEAVVDRISLEWHMQSKIAKDVASAAVGLAIIMNMIAWLYAIYLSSTNV